MADQDALAVVGHPEGKPLTGGARDSFCVRLWQHMRIEASGEGRVCCAYRGDLVTTDGATVATDQQSLMEIWNADTMRELRRAMVEGRRVAGCEPCYSVEARGGESIRTHDNLTWEQGRRNDRRLSIDQMIDQAVDHDFRLPKLPETIEVETGNVCNLKCRMCNGRYSHRIAKDPVHGQWNGSQWLQFDDRGTPVIAGKTHRSETIGLLCDELAKDTASQVKVLYFLGGEPFLIREIAQLVERLVAVGRSRQMSLLFTSNGSLVPKWLSLAPQFRKIDLVISVDGHAEHYDYIRYPARWSKLANHLEVFKKSPNTSLLVRATIQINNVLNLTNLFRYLDAAGIAFTGYLLDYPHHLAVSALPASIRRLAAARLTEYAEGDCRPEHRALVLSFVSQIESGDEAGNPDHLRDFMRFTNDLDASRGQSIHRTDPELVDLLEQAGVPWLHDTLHAPAASVSEETRRWRRSVLEARNAAAKLQRELDATRDALNREPAQSRDTLVLGEVDAEPARRELARVRLELAQIHASRSWQLTRPLRTAGRGLRRWLQGTRRPGQPAAE